MKTLNTFFGIIFFIGLAVVIEAQSHASIVDTYATWMNKFWKKNNPTDGKKEVIINQMMVKPSKNVATLRNNARSKKTPQVITSCPQLRAVTVLHGGLIRYHYWKTILTVQARFYDYNINAEQFKSVLLFADNNHGISESCLGSLSAHHAKSSTIDVVEALAEEFSKILNKGRTSQLIDEIYRLKKSQNLHSDLLEKEHGSLVQKWYKYLDHLIQYLDENCMYEASKNLVMNLVMNLTKKETVTDLAQLSYLQSRQNEEVSLAHIGILQRMLNNGDVGLYVVEKSPNKIVKPLLEYIFQNRQTNVHGIESWPSKSEANEQKLVYAALTSNEDIKLLESVEKGFRHYINVHEKVNENVIAAIKNIPVGVMFMYQENHTWKSNPIIFKAQLQRKKTPRGQFSAKWKDVIDKDFWGDEDDDEDEENTSFMRS